MCAFRVRRYFEDVKRVKGDVVRRKAIQITIEKVYYKMHEKEKSQTLKEVNSLLNLLACTCE